MLWHHEGTAYVEGTGIEAKRVSNQWAVHEPLLCLEAAANSDGSLGSPHPAVGPTNFPWLPRASDPAHTRGLGAHSTSLPRLMLSFMAHVAAQIVGAVFSLWKTLFFHSPVPSHVC